MSEHALMPCVIESNANRVVSRSVTCAVFESRHCFTLRRYHRSEPSEENAQKDRSNAAPVVCSSMVMHAAFGFDRKFSECMG